MWSKIYVKLAHTGFALGLVRESALYYINLCENFSNFENLANFYGSYLLSLSCIDVEPKKIKDESRKFNIVANHFINGGMSFNKQIVRGAREKIHIAYMSPDYRNHVMFCFYYALLKYYDTDKFYVNFNVENESFGVKEKIIISNTKSKILFHYSDTMEPVVIVEEAIPNRFVRLFFPKFYRYHFVVPEDKVVETYIE